jgi:hypothetical protein
MIGQIPAVHQAVNRLRSVIACQFIHPHGLAHSSPLAKHKIPKMQPAHRARRNDTGRAIEKEAEEGRCSRKNDPRDKRGLAGNLD